MSYKLTDGPYAGYHVFTAEHIRPLVQVGQRLSAGQPVALGYGQSETGWAAGAGRQTYAATHGGYSEGQGTQAGRHFSDFLRTIGGIPGTSPTSGWRPGGTPVPGGYGR